MPRVLVIGGPGTISTSLIADRASRGDEVVVFTRPKASRPEVDATVVYGDRDDEEAIARAVHEHRPDVVVDTICFTPEQADALVRSAAGRIAQLVTLSTVDVYGLPLSRLPMREDDPWTTPRSPYAERKIACEQRLRRAHEDGSFALTIARPGYSLGPTNALSPMWRGGAGTVVRRARRGLPILVPGDGTTLLHPGTGTDAGRMIAAIVALPAAYGRDYSCVGPAPMTHDDYVRMVARAGGAEPRIVHVPTELLLEAHAEELRDSLLTELSRWPLAFSGDRLLADVPDFTWQESVEEGIRRHVERQEALGALDAAPEEALDDVAGAAWEAARRAYRAQLAPVALN